MKKIIILIGILSTLIQASEIKNLFKEVNKGYIVNSINKISLDSFSDAYTNVINQLQKEKNWNGEKKLLDKERFKVLALNYKDMLLTIANNESAFIHEIGITDKYDISFFQLNIRKNIWSEEKLSKLTKKEISKESLLNNIDLASYSALHVMLYNIAIYTNFHKIEKTTEKDLPKLIAAYNHPINLNDNYVKKAKLFLKSNDNYLKKGNLILASN